MKISLIVLLIAFAAGGCAGTTGSKGTDMPKTVDRDTILISTTKGDMKVVLFPVFVSVEGKLILEPREKQYTEFLSGIAQDYYNNAAFSSHKDIFGEFALFTSPSGGNYAVQAMPRDVQPVRGTLCIMRMDSGNNPGIFADKRQFLIVRTLRRVINGQEYAPWRGTYFPIGQVIDGFDVLDKLEPNDTITKITMLKDKTPVNTEKLELLGNEPLAQKRGVKPIDNFADVLSDKPIEPATGGADSGEAPPAPGP